MYAGICLEYLGICSCRITEETCRNIQEYAGMRLAVEEYGWNMSGMYKNMRLQDYGGSM